MTNDRKKFTCRIPLELKARMDSAVEARKASDSIGQQAWVIEAIKEKLDREDHVVGKGRKK